MSETKQNGKAIALFRELLRHQSRDDLAQKLGISYPYLANIENEHKDATPALMYRIASELDIPVEAILRHKMFEQQVA